MPNDVYNPFEADEVNLQDILRRAVAEKLRARPAMEDLSARANYAGSQAQADRDFNEALGKRSSLAEADKAQIAQLLKNYDPETQALGSNRLTFPQAMTNVKELESARLDDKERATRAARRQAEAAAALEATHTQMGPPDPSAPRALPQSATAARIVEAMEDLDSNRPHLVARAKEFLKQTEGKDPKNMVRLNPATGQYEVIGGALDAYQQQVGGAQQQQHPGGILVPDGYGGQMLVQPFRPPGVQQGQGQGQGQGQPPPDPRLNGAATSAAPPTAPPTQTPPGGAVSGPNTAVTGLPPGAPPTAAPPMAAAPGGMQVPPQVQLERDVVALNQIKQELAQSKDPREQQALTQEIGYRQQRIEKLAAQIRSSAPQGAPGQAPQGGPVPLQPPVGQPGVRNPSPSETKIYEQQRESRETASNKAMEKSPNIPETEMILQRMKALNDKQMMYTGTPALPMSLESLISTFTGGKTERGRNTELFGMDSGDLQAAIIRDYGSGNSISDADLLATAKRVITADMDPRTRDAAIQRLQEKLDAHKFMQPILRQYVQQGIPHQEAANAAWEQYKVFKAEKDAAQRVEAAKAASPTSVPGATASPTSAPISPEEQKRLTHTGAPPSALSQTMDAIGDVAKNTGRGAMNLVGLGDREAAVADVQRQENRAASEPVYKSQKEILDIAKYAPGLFLGPLGGAAYAGGMAASEPKESATGQIMSGVGGAVLGGVGSGALNSTRLALVKGQMGKLFDIMDKVATDTPAFKAAAAKLAQLEPEFIALSKKTASDTLAPIGRAANATWDAIPGPLQKALKALGAGATATAGGLPIYKYFTGGK